jgi:hypothetical protein
MLALTLTTAEFTAISDDLKKEYQLTTDGTYKLDLGPNVFTTDKDPEGLFSALEKTREELKTVKAVADKFEAEKKQTEIDGIKSVAELKEHFQSQLDARDAAAKAAEEKQKVELAAQRQNNADRMAREKALTIASELFGTNAAIMLPHVQGMLKGKVSAEGQASIEITDIATNLPSIDQSFENFQKSLSTNEMFKSMVVVSKASGGSANGDGKSTTLATTKDDGSPKTYNDYNSGELVRMKRDQPEAFQTLLESSKTS